MKTVLLFAAILCMNMSFSQDQTGLRQKQFNIGSKQIGIEGYDPVAYFSEGKAKEGKASIAIYYAGITYYFSTAGNKELFKKNPSQYEPQYGGWCAYAMGNDGSKVEVDPETFKIINGKLYLFYNKYFTNTLKSWNKNETTLMKSADGNWLKFYH
jgi:YHS domain-containing protein